MAQNKGDYLQRVELGPIEADLFLEYFIFRW